MSPQPELVFNIALTHELLGDCKSALEAYDHYLATAGASADRERATENHAALLKRCGPPPVSTPLQPLAASPAVLSMNEPSNLSAPATVPPAALSDSGEAPPPDSQLQTQLGWGALGAAVVSLGAVVYFDVQRRGLHSEFFEAKSE